MTSDAEKIRKSSQDMLERERNYKEALRLALDWQRDRDNHKLALPAKMGNSKSYLTSVSLGWIAANVYFSRDLPIFKKHIRQDTNIIDINSTTATYLQQRAPDFSRQLPMTMYLATREHHKFPPLLLVAYQNWVYEPGDDNWGPDGRAMTGSLHVERLDTTSYVVDLDVTGTSYFALDGQHRLMAIKGLKELLDNGRLSARKKDGSIIVGRDVTRDELEEYYENVEFDPDRLQSAMDEVIGVEIIPAVQDKETFKQAVSRLRNVFVDVNENAKRLEKGELTLLDENDGFRIVARTVMTNHRLFEGSDGLNVETKANQISEASSSYTTLNALVSIAREYLSVKPEFEGWNDAVLGLRGNRGVGLLRPGDDEIEKGLVVLSEYFDELAELPSHKSMLERFQTDRLIGEGDGNPGKSPSELRGGSADNILFRPIAQVALARAIAELQRREGLGLKETIECLSFHEILGDLVLRSKTAPWFGILCDPIHGKVRRQKGYEDLCVEMMIYLLGGGFAEDRARREKLRDDFFEARMGATEGDETMAYDLSGSLKTKEAFRLPDPWSASK